MFELAFDFESCSVLCGAERKEAGKAWVWRPKAGIYQQRRLDSRVRHLDQLIQEWNHSSSTGKHHSKPLWLLCQSNIFDPGIPIGVIVLTGTIVTALTSLYITTHSDRMRPSGFQLVQGLDACTFDDQGGWPKKKYFGRYMYYRTILFLSSDWGDHNQSAAIKRIGYICYVSNLLKKCIS